MEILYTLKTMVLSYAQYVSEVYPIDNCMYITERECIKNLKSQHT